MGCTTTLPLFRVDVPIELLVFQTEPYLRIGDRDLCTSPDCVLVEQLPLVCSHALSPSSPACTLGSHVDADEAANIHAIS